MAVVNEPAPPPLFTLAAIRRLRGRITSSPSRTALISAPARSGVGKLARCTPAALHADCSVVARKHGFQLVADV